MPGAAALMPAWMTPLTIVSAGVRCGTHISVAAGGVKPMVAVFAPLLRNAPIWIGVVPANASELMLARPTSLGPVPTGTPHQLPDASSVPVPDQKSGLPPLTVVIELRAMTVPAA